MDELKLYTHTFKQIISDVVKTNIPKNYSQGSTYQNSVDYKKRCEESNRIYNKYPSHIPVIINCTDKEITLKKVKYLVPKNTYCSQLMVSVRSQIKDIDSGKALFLFINNIVVDNMKTINELYLQYKDKNNIKPGDDVFLYITLTSENTFG